MEVAPNADTVSSYVQQRTSAAPSLAQCARKWKATELRVAGRRNVGTFPVRLQIDLSQIFF
jgi:hypothetical protein